MKPILIACLAEIVCVILVTVRFRFFPTERRARFMVGAYALLVPLVAALNVRGGEGLYAFVDAAFSVFVYSAGFFGGVLQLYNLADRGFSLRIAIDIHERPSGTMTLEEVMTGYGAGKGISWMYGKRIEGMVSSGLVEIRDGNVVNTAKGRKTARVFALLRTFYNRL
jgi:hypothetical protein